MADGTLSAIHLHPIKSCRRVEVDRAIVADHGLRGDRLWQVVDTEGKPLTQRQHPVLATVRPEFIEDPALIGDPETVGESGSAGGTSSVSGLRITAPGRSTLVVGAPGHGAPTAARTLFGVAVDSGDAGDEAAAWFSDLLAVPVRLVGGAPTAWKHLPERFDIWQQPLTFTDAGPVLVANSASLDWLVDRADEPFGMDRFRPNLVVETDRPWAEDTWDRFRIGTAELVQGMPWPRCAVPQIDQDTGDRNPEPARALRRHRWCEAAPEAPESMRKIVEGNGLFGIGCSIGPAGTVVSVGDDLSVDSTRRPVLAAPR